MEKLEVQLETLIENMRHLAIVVSDMQPQTGQQVLNQKIHQIVESLNSIDKHKASVDNVQVPVEVFEYIDKSKNPHLFTKDFMEKALIKNEQVKGKIDYYRQFKETLIEQLALAFPAETNTYTTLRPNTKTQ